MSSAPPLPTRPITLYWLSQTGTAKGICEMISGDAKDHSLTIACSPCEDLSLDSLFNEPAIRIFIAASTGNGEPPDHAVKWWKSLKRSEVSQ
jgi:methionine synthase reductase